MTLQSFLKLGSIFVLLGTGAACKSSLAQPFDKMQTADMTVYRLQNFEPQPAASATPGIPGLPAGIPDLITQGQKLLQQWGLPAIPIPGLGTPTPAQDTAQRFYTYRILAIRPVADPSVKSDLASLFGSKDNFSDKPDACMYPDFGVAMFNQQTGQHADVAVSIGCEQVRALNFQWPYAQIGVPPDTSRKLVEIVKKVFQGG
jgi:hypothetical protein